MLTAVVLTDSGLPFQGARRESGAARGECAFRLTAHVPDCQTTQSSAGNSRFLSWPLWWRTKFVLERSAFPEVLKKYIKFSLNERMN